MKVYLIGLPGSGKSFLGKKLADKAKIPFIDLDQAIEQEAGLSISKIFSDKGEEYFRNLEAVALRQQSKAPEFVMACGGGTPCFHDNMKFINQTGTSIFLNTHITEIAERLRASENTRPLMTMKSDDESLEDKLEKLSVNRLPFYEQAELILKGGETTIAEILQQLKTKN